LQKERKSFAPSHGTATFLIKVPLARHFVPEGKSRKQKNEEENSGMQIARKSWGQC
jgi:hypothetical protein